MVAFGQNLETTRTESSVEVDRVCGEILAQYLTQAPGQAMVYLAKEAEAKDFIKDTAPAMVEYPFVMADMDGSGLGANQVCQIILNKSQLWRRVGSSIERARMIAKTAIEAATTIREIRMAEEKFQRNCLGLRLF